MRMPFRALLGLVPVLLAVSAAAEPELHFAAHPDEAVDGALIAALPFPDDEQSCLDLCRAEPLCRAVRDDAEGCHLFSSVSGSRPADNVDSWVGVMVDPSTLRRERMDELAGLHPDYFFRADALWLTLPVADGEPDTLLASARDALDGGDFLAAETRYAGAFGLERRISGLWLAGARALVGRLAMDPPEDRATAAGLREFAVSAALNAYLTALDRTEQLAALATLGDGLAESGDFIAAVAAGRRLLALSADGAFAASVETWAEQAAANAPAPPARRVEPATFGVWHVACDNALSCVASAFAEGDFMGTLRVDYWRDAGPAAAPHLAVFAQLDEASNLSVPAENLFFDGPGEAEPVLAPLAWSPDAEPSMVVVPAAATRGLAELVIASDELLLRAGRDRPVLGTMALAGLAGAIAHIDALQGRAATETAFLDPGPRPATSVAQPPALPIAEVEPVDGAAIDAAPPEPVLDAWRAECDEADIVVEDGGPPAEGYRLGADGELWLIGCSKGAYNQGMMAFRAGPEAVTPLNFSWPNGSNDNPEITNPSVERETDAAAMADRDSGLRPFVLVGRDLGRGFGDCGQITRHVYHRGAFHLLDQAVMDQCQGWTWPWPLVWRAWPRAAR